MTGSPTRGLVERESGSLLNGSAKARLGDLHVQELTTITTAAMTKVEPTKEPPVIVLGIDITRFTPNTQFFICSAGVFIVYQGYAYLQEYVFKIDGFHYAWFMAFFTFITAVLFSSIERLQRREPIKAPMSWYVVIGALTVLCQGFTMLSLNHVNYPTMIVFKSAKVIPVMAAGILVQKKVYSCLEYTAAAFFFLGLCMFTLADVTTQPKFDVAGIVCLMVALLGDAFVGNIQEKVLRRFQVSLPELTQNAYAWASVFCFGVLIATGELWPALELCQENTYIYVLLFALSTCNYLGVQLVLTLVNTFGAVTAVVVTSSRKLLTIFLSFVFFPKPFSSLYLWGSLALFGGMLLHTYARNPKETAALFLRILQRTGLVAGGSHHGDTTQHGHGRRTPGPSKSPKDAGRVENGIAEAEP